MRNAATRLPTPTEGREAARPSTMCDTSPDYSNDEFRALIAARKHFGEEDLDQFVHWRIACSWGEVYVTISNSPGPGAEPRMFDLVGPEMPLQGEPGGPATAGRCLPVHWTAAAGLAKGSGQVVGESLSKCLPASCVAP